MNRLIDGHYWSEVWPLDHVSSEERLNPRVNLHHAKQRAVQIELCRRWLPEHLLPIFDELMKQE